MDLDQSNQRPVTLVMGQGSAACPATPVIPRSVWIEGKSGRGTHRDELGRLGRLKAAALTNQWRSSSILH